jgi:hypothetical protein
MSASLKSPATLFVLGVFLIMTAVLPAPRPVSASSVLYAAPTATGSADCSSWTNACTLQTALTNATSGDQIWVRQGVHRPGSNQTDTFTLENGVAVYGGFAGTETSLNQRDWQTNVTVLSGDIDQNDIVDANGVVTSTANIAGVNAYHVVTGGGTNNTAVLDGFVITSGNANSPFPPDDAGGGMYNNNSSPTLRNLIFSGNAANSGGGMANLNSSNPTLTNVTFSGNAAGFGGGMYNENSSNPTLTNVTFSSNTAQSGGGMHNFYSSPTLTNVTFSGNAAQAGGGMLNSNSNPVLTNVTFSGNTASGMGSGGGGMFNYDNSSPTLTNVTFSSNTAQSGGGMYNFDSSPTLTNVIFSGNAAQAGGGMFNENSSPILTNVIFSGNAVTVSGGGMANFNGSNPNLINVTFSGNTASSGGGMANNNSNPTLTNVIIWNSVGGSIIDSFSTPDVTYSNIQGGYLGTDNINADPLFVDADGPDNIVGTLDDNLRLQSGSPSIDTGNNAAVPTGVTTDLEGKPRIQNGTVDMGAYEYDNTPPTVVSITRADPNPTNAASVTFVVTFTEAVTGVGVADFALTLTGGVSGASVTGVSGSGAVYTVTVSTGTGNGTLRLDIPNTATITDLAGNALSGLPFTGGQVYTVDKTAPGVTMTSSAPNPTNSAPIPVTVTFSEPVTGFTAGDIAVSNGSVSNFAGGGASYTFDLTPAANGLVTATIAANVAVDAAGNGNTAASFSRTYDTIAPGVASITRADPNPTSAASVTFVVTFTEAVTGVGVADFALTVTGISGASVTGVSGSGAVYTVTVSTGTGDGTLRLDIPNTATITDLAGNALSGLPFTGGQVYTVDKTAPGVTAITRADPNPTNSASVTFVVTFTEAVTGVGVADFALTVTGISGASVTGVSGSGAIYTVTVSTGTGNGTLRLDIPNTATITDLAGNALSGLPYTGGQVYTVDKTAPGVTMTSSAPNPTNSAPIPVTVTFSEPVTGFTAGDIAVSNGSVSNFAGGGASYTFDLIPAANGPVTATIAANVAVDAVGNGNTAASFSRTYDTTAPGVTAITRADPNPTNAASVNFIVTFTEAVTGVGVADFALTVTGISGASVTGVSGSGAIYTVTVSTGTGNGTLRLDIPNTATITDLAGNALSGLPYTGGQVYTVDKTAPGVTAITRADPNPTNATSVTFVVTFTEAVTGVGVADFALTLTGGISGASVTGVSGSGAVYTVTVSTGTGNGTLRLDIPNTAVITDLAGNALSGLPYTSGETYQKVYRVFLPLIVR